MNMEKQKQKRPTTLYIKHLADSANFKGITFNKHRNGLIGNRFELPNVSYTFPLSEKPAQIYLDMYASIMHTYAYEDYIKYRR